MAIRAVLFDCDGVIVDNMRTVWSRLHLCCSVALRRRGIWVKNSAPLFEEFPAVFHSLVAQGLKLGVVSTNDCLAVSLVLANAGVYPRVSYLACGVGGEEAKTKAIKKFCRDFGFEPVEVLFFGDRRVDIDAGKKTGVLTAVFRPANDRRFCFRLNGADFRISRHAEILDIINAAPHVGVAQRRSELAA